MLTNPIMDKLSAMRLTGMAKALTEQMEMQDLNSLTFDERLGLMVDREMLDREDRRLATRLRKAKLRVPACMEDIDFRHKRGLDKSLVMSLAGCQWIKGRQNLIITGPTGVGKTYLACALVHKACLMGTRSRLPPPAQSAEGNHHRSRRWQLSQKDGRLCQNKSHRPG
jgi:DNA replication protein DnaC